MSRVSRASSKRAQKPTAVQAEAVVNPLVTLMHNNSSTFDKEIVAKIKGAMGKLTRMEDALRADHLGGGGLAPADAGLAHAQRFADELFVANQELFALFKAARDFRETLSKQTKAVSTRIAKLEASKQGRNHRPRSAARRLAGMVKAASLVQHQQDLREAREQLRGEGYTGSLYMKKGSAVHSRVQSIKRRRVLTSELDVVARPDSVGNAAATDLRLPLAPASASTSRARDCVAPPGLPEDSGLSLA